MSRFLVFCLVVVARDFAHADDCLADESSHDFTPLIQTKVKTSRPAHDDAANTSSMQLVVRYAMLSPSGNLTYLDKVGLPQLGSSICLAEKNLATGMVTRFGSPNSYLIYTDHRTHKHVDRFLAAAFNLQTTSRVKLINLDEDPEDDARMLPFKNIGLDDVNFASVRRTLADTKHQLAGSGRLLLGTDVSFLAPPDELLKEMSLIGAEDAKSLYLAYGGFTLAHYDGQQCPDLNADFVYMSAGVKLNLTSLVEKMLWYASLPKIHGRFISNDTTTQHWEMKNNWLHGLDQWALMMSLAEVVKPQGPQGCRALSVDRYTAAWYGLAGRNERAGIHRQGVEVAHDKIVSKCLAGA